MGSRGDSPRSEKMKATGSNPVESISLLIDSFFCIFPCFSDDIRARRARWGRGGIPPGLKK